MSEKIIAFNDVQADIADMPPMPDDDQIALWITPEWQQRFGFIRRSWHEYSSGCWRPVDNEEMRCAVRILLRGLRQFGVKVRQSRITQILQMLQDDLFIPDRALNVMIPERERYINLRNGLFNLETFELEPHRRELFFTSQLDFDYDPKALPDVFLSYLNTTFVHPETHYPDQDLTNLVQEALAYSLTARTDLKASFWLYGVPDSGKSTLLRLIANLMGDLHVTIDLNQLGENRFMLSRIAGKRAVSFSEADTNSMIPDGIYKAIVGGKDEIWADVKGRESISFIPEAKFWWAMNKPPRVNDRSGAMFNRLWIIPMNRSVPANKRIRNLDELLMQERSGIFNWLMTAYKRLVRNGKFTRSAQAEAMRAQLEEDNDIEKSFVEDYCDVHESYFVKAVDLQRAYTTWCMENGFRSKTRNQVRWEWERLGFKKDKSNTTIWRGLRLKSW